MGGREGDFLTFEEVNPSFSLQARVRKAGERVSQKRDFSLLRVELLANESAARKAASHLQSASKQQTRSLFCASFLARRRNEMVGF